MPNSKSDAVESVKVFCSRKFSERVKRDYGTVSHAIHVHEGSSYYRTMSSAKCVTRLAPARCADLLCQVGLDLRLDPVLLSDRRTFDSEHALSRSDYADGDAMMRGLRDYLHDAIDQHAKQEELTVRSLAAESGTPLRTLAEMRTRDSKLGVVSAIKALENLGYTVELRPSVVERAAILEPA